MRAKIALGEAEEVVAELEGEEDTPDYAAVKALALYSVGDTEAALTEIERLSKSAASNATVQVIGGGILHNAGKSDEALALLSGHQGNLEA